MSPHHARLLRHCIDCGERHRIQPAHVRPSRFPRERRTWWLCFAYGETMHRTVGAALNELAEALRNWGHPPV